MVDRIGPERRSENMRRIRSADTRPELEVRRLIHGMGYRFRLHDKSLPGTPDLIFASRKAIIFVHGCFWHRHLGCRHASVPSTRTQFWLDKFAENESRDRNAVASLVNAGWRVETVWQCELKDRDNLARKLRALLDG
jgi:DNA mismatch endonuclease (patch repair protein)